MATVTTQNAAVANRTAIALASGYETYNPISPVVFKDVDPTRRDEIFSIHAHDGSFTEVGEAANFPSVDILQVGSLTLTQRTFKKKLVVSKLMQRFDSENAIMEEAMMIGFDARVSADQLCADVLNAGFTTETTWDGNSLFNNSHVVGSLAVVNDNLNSGALTDTSLNDGIVLMRDLVSHRGLAMPVLPRFLIVPTALEKKARELLDSGLDPESANNSVNTHRSRGITVVVWELLTSTTAWFLAGDKMYHKLVKLVSIPFTVENRPGIYTESGSAEVRVDYALEAGAPDYLGVVGSLGT